MKVRKEGTNFIGFRFESEGKDYVCVLDRTISIKHVNKI